MSPDAPQGFETPAAASVIVQRAVGLAARSRLEANSVIGGGCFDAHRASLAHPPIRGRGRSQRSDQSSSTARASGAKDGVAERGRRVSLHAREDVLVDGHGECWAAVAKAFADDLHGDVGLQEDGGVGVA